MPNIETASSAFSSKASLNSSSTADKKKKKKGRIKRLSGLITGESRREKKARKAAERAAAGKPPLLDSQDDEESVYGIAIDDVSQATEMVGGSGTPRAPSGLLGKTEDKESATEEELTFLSPKPTPALQVILLLMDPNTRRFELLQLEFDSNKALVSDVIAQIPLSVTEEQLRLQNYNGVCDRSGVEMIKSMRLSEFCKTNEVILAIPDNMAAKECARLARPILADEGVISMLRASGINTDPPTPVSPADARDITLSDEAILEKEMVGSSARNTTIAIVLVTMIAVILQGVQMLITAPLRPGSAMEPGMWMSKCGLLSALPVCENSGLEMGEDSVLTLHGSDGSVQWKIQGGKCRASNKECEPGLLVKEDGNLVIGGRSITSVTIKGDAPLTPWPFEREPKLRVVRK